MQSLSLRQVSSTTSMYNVENMIEDAKKNLKFVNNSFELAKNTFIIRHCIVKERYNVS